MSSQTNSFVSGPLGPIYARTALPIIFVMGMNGALAAPLIFVLSVNSDALRNEGLVMFMAALTFALVGSVGEPGIWLAAPVAEVMLVGLMALVLAQVARAQSLRWGLFITAGEVRA